MSELSRIEHPMCRTCEFVLPSETAQTKLRCGLSYFRSTPFMRKFQLMQHFPEVKEMNACESWQLKPTESEQDQGWSMPIKPQTKGF